MAQPYVATCIDLPAGSPGGSVELFLDLYTGSQPVIAADAFMLQPTTGQAPVPAGLGLLTVAGKCVEGPGFWRYVDRLRHALTEQIDPGKVDVVHLQHLAFGGAPALSNGLPDHPQIAFVHGTDLLFAETYPDQLQVLKEIATQAAAIVVPTGAMADRLLELEPGTDRSKIHRIPWGIPDHLHNSLAAHRPPAAEDRGEQLRLLYAGRLTSEKGGRNLVDALTGAGGVHLSIAAPEAEFDTLAPALDRSGVPFTYLGWLDRRQLWDIFADHNALLMPSTTLEAMGLVALEAQACGLPVIYQPVPGLLDTLGDSALATDFTDTTAVATAIRRFKTSPMLQAELRDSGRANAAKYPLSRTATMLTELGQNLSASAPRDRTNSMRWSQSVPLAAEV